MKPIGRNIKIKLPDYQKKGERELMSGIIIPHLLGNFQHNCSHGTVVEVADACEIAKKGDEVFFNQMLIQNALRNAGRDQAVNENLQKSSSGVPVFYLEENGDLFLIMPECRMYTKVFDVSGSYENTLHSGVIVIIREGELVPCNNYVIMQKGYDDGKVVDGVKVVKSGLISVVKLREEEEKNKRFKVICAEGELKKDEVIVTAPHCDVNLEGWANFPIFPDNTYYCEEQYVMATLNTA